MTPGALSISICVPSLLELDTMARRMPARQYLHDLCGRDDLPGVVAVVDVRVEDRQFLVGRGGSGGDEREQDKQGTHRRSITVGPAGTNRS